MKSSRRTAFENGRSKHRTDDLVQCGPRQEQSEERGVNRRRRSCIRRAFAVLIVVP